MFDDVDFEVADIFGVEQLLDGEDFVRLLTRSVVNLILTAIIVHGVYARIHKQREYVFTYYLFNIITFSLCFALRKVPIELGFALGLFAVFGILRYRTESIRIRDLTYLFVVIGIGILNAVANKKVSLAELALVDGIIIGAVLLLERAPFARREDVRPVMYDNLELLRSGDKQALIEDLKKRTGLKVVRVEVQMWDLLRDFAQLNVYYEPE